MSVNVLLFVLLDNIDQIANTLQHNNMTSSTSKTPTSYINIPQPFTSTPQPSTTTNLQRTQNFFRRMHDITHQKYALTYQIKSQESTTRLQLALAWSKLNPQGTVEILKLQKGFLLKTNLPQQQADSHLMSLIATKKFWTTLHSMETIVLHWILHQQPTMNHPIQLWSAKWSQK